MKSIVMRIVPIALIAVLILTAQPAAAADGPKWADPESPLYGLKIALENADEALSFSKEARLEKQLAHAEARLAEAQAMGDQNRTMAMERAVERYEVKLGQINETVCEGNVSKQHTEHAMNMTQKHQGVLSGLLERIDNGTMPEQARNGIERALNNSIRHEERFAHKHEADYGHTWMKDTDKNETDENLVMVTIKGTSVWAELCDPNDEDAVIAVLTSGTQVWVELPEEDKDVYRGNQNRIKTKT